MIRDRIVVGVRDRVLSTRLQMEADLNPRVRVVQTHFTIYLQKFQKLTTLNCSKNVLIVGNVVTQGTNVWQEMLYAIHVTEELTSNHNVSQVSNQCDEDVTVVVYLDVLNLQSS